MSCLVSRCRLIARTHLVNWRRVGRNRAIARVLGVAT